MSEDTDRYVPIEDWSIDDHTTFIQSGKRLETDEYRKRREREGPPALDQMSLEDHLQAVQRNRG